MTFFPQDQDPALAKAHRSLSSGLSAYAWRLLLLLILIVIWSFVLFANANRLIDDVETFGTLVRLSTAILALGIVIAGLRGAILCRRGLHGLGIRCRSRLFLLPSEILFAVGYVFLTAPAERWQVLASQLPIDPNLRQLLLLALPILSVVPAILFLIAHFFSLRVLEHLGQLTDEWPNLVSHAMTLRAAVRFHAAAIFLCIPAALIPILLDFTSLRFGSRLLGACLCGDGVLYLATALSGMIAFQHGEKLILTIDHWETERMGESTT